MNKVLTLNSINEAHDHFDEYLIGFKELSRTGDFKGELKKLPAKRLILEWDILMVDEDLVRAIEFIQTLDLSLFDAIRVQDPGALQYVIETYPNLKVQWIVETGNHNLKALQTWEECIGKNLERLILSPEIPRSNWETYISYLRTPIEVFVHGRLLLFYSPRKLLSPLFEQDELRKKIEILGKSEESPHKGFPLLENDHGTFMFHPRELCLIDKISEIIASGVQYIRYDLRHTKRDENLITALINNNFEQIKTDKKYFKGFYQVNKTDAQFDKMKNKNINRFNPCFLGEILSVERDDYMVLKFHYGPYKAGDSLQLNSPEGKKGIYNFFEIKNLKGEPVSAIDPQQIYQVKYIKGFPAKTTINRV